MGGRDGSAAGSEWRPLLAGGAAGAGAALPVRARGGGCSGRTAGPWPSVRVRCRRRGCSGFAVGGLGCRGGP